MQLSLLSKGQDRIGREVHWHNWRMGGRKEGRLCVEAD